MRHRHLNTALILTSLTLAWGCATKTVYVIPQPGNPLMVLDNVTVSARLLSEPKEAPAVKQDIGGWMAMPFSWWEEERARLLQWNAVKGMLTPEQSAAAKAALEKKP